MLYFSCESVGCPQESEIWNGSALSCGRGPGTLKTTSCDCDVAADPAYHL